MSYFSKLCFIFIALLLVQSCAKKDKNSSTPENEWVQLFNGKDLTGWNVKINGYAVNENIHNTFRVENGALKVSYEGYDNFGTSYGHIFYKTPYSNYKLKLQYRFVGEQVKDGQGWATKNSGVMIHSQSPESMDIDQSFPVSLEVQLLGGLEEGVERPTGNLCTPGTHVEMNDTLIEQHCIRSSSPTFYGEEWINLEIQVYSDSLITHLINGEKVISYSKPIFGGEYNTTFKEGEPVKGGYISLQSESHPIEFRKIELMELN